MKRRDWLKGLLLAPLALLGMKKVDPKWQFKAIDVSQFFNGTPDPQMQVKLEPFEESKLCTQDGKLTIVAHSHFDGEWHIVAQEC